MAGAASFKDSDHSSPSSPGLDTDSGLPELTSDQGSGLMFMEGEFRVGVDFPSDSDEVVFQLRRLVQKTNRRCEPDALSI
jgi:hypothetical protein